MKKLKYIDAPKQTIYVDELKAGDILCTHGERWLAEKIQFFMEVQAHKWYSVEMWEYYNHMLRVLNAGANANDIEVGEALGKGYDIHSLASQYNTESINNMIAIRVKEVFNSEEVEIMNALSQRRHDANIKYEYTNFLWWVPYIYSKGRWYWGPKGNKVDDRLFCFESSLTEWAKVRPEMFEHPSRETTVSAIVEYRNKIDIFLVRTRSELH